MENLKEKFLVIEIKSSLYSRYYAEVSGGAHLHG